MTAVLDYIEPAIRDLAVPLDTVKLDDKNARLHSKRNLDSIAKSLGGFKQQKPIVVTADGRCIAGNGTLEAAKALGWSHIAVAQTTLKGDHAKAYAIADNRTAELAEWEDKILAEALVAIQDSDEIDADATGFTSREIDSLVSSTSGEIEEDEVPGPPKKAITQRGDLWKLGEHRLLCGDATDGEDVGRVMGGERADCVFTSPPYGVGLDYLSYDDTIDNLRKLLALVAQQWVSVVVDGGFAVINFGDIISAKDIVGTDEPCEYPMALEYYPLFRELGWLLWSRRVWCKPGARTDSMQCISSNRAATNWEHMWTWKRPGVPPVDKQTLSPHPSQFGWFNTTVGPPPEVGSDIHPAGMPVAAAAWIVDIHSRRRKIAFDPFLGSGTTLIAAEQLNRRCYGLEIEPKYCDVIVQRWENLTGRKAERIKAG